MPPEALLLGKFTVESDIYSFGILLWEIYTLALQPYYGYTNEEVVEFIKKVCLVMFYILVLPGVYLVGEGEERGPRTPCFFRILKKYCVRLSSDIMHQAPVCTQSF